MLQNHDTAQENPRGFRDDNRPVSTGKPRAALFKTWIIVTTVLLLGSWGLGAVLSPDRIGLVEGGVIFPVLTGILLFLSLIWLAWIVFGPSLRKQR